MKIGDWQLQTISGGRFKTDGGTMFAVVPKPLWSRKVEPDELNRIQEDTRCLLIQTGAQNILVDTGYGPKLSDKQRRLIVAEEGNPLERSLSAAGLSCDEIDLVILSHLHFDHAGGVTRFNVDSDLELQFPNARHIIQQGEWDTATADWPELKGVYPRENFDLLAGSPQLELVSGDVEILPGIRTIVTGGHTEFHQAIVIEQGGEAFYFLADICPSSRHLRTAWCIGYDLFQLQSRRIKRKLLAEIAERNAWLVFDHDAETAGAKVKPDGEGEFVVGERREGF
jgi:glyoxylase-like metal-dependent hydrolase (beta-lactamase superfamily II)